MNRSIVPLLILMAACSKPKSSTVSLPSNPLPSRGFEPPVMISPDPGVEYPPALFDQGIEGKVVLRLFTDTAGQILPESTRVAESSGFPALDSAAVNAAPRFLFSPGRSNGAPTATAFLQPIHFRHPPRGGTTP
ncbi:MAG: energy transducer TonB [Gemmatimonadota bacterium]